MQKNKKVTTETLSREAGQDIFAFEIKIFYNVSIMKKEFMTKTYVVWIGALICSILWGSAFPCIKLGYNMMNISSSDTAAQILYAGLRFTLAGILAIIIGSATSKKFLYPKKEAYSKVIVLSLFQTIIQYLFFYIGLAHTDGTKASIIEGMNVFVAIVVSCLIFKMEKLTVRKVIGCIVGFVGVILVNVSGKSLDMNMSITGEGFIFLSTVSYAFSSVMLKKYSKDENTVMLSGWQFVFGGIVMTVAGLLMGGKITSFKIDGVLMLIYLALVSAVAYSLWSLLLTYNPVSRVAVFGFMNPMIGFILSAIMLKEYDALSIVAFISLGLVCLGIYVVNKQKIEKGM